MRKSAARGKVISICMVSFWYCLFHWEWYPLAKQWYSKLSGKRRLQTFSLGRTQDSENGSVKGQVSGNADTSFQVSGLQSGAFSSALFTLLLTQSDAWGSIVMGRRIKGRHCCSRQKYCNGNYFTGWGSGILPSSSHFSSGQSLWIIWRIWVCLFHKARVSWAESQKKDRRNQRSPLLQGQREWLSRCTERPLEYSSVATRREWTWYFSAFFI